MGIPAAICCSSRKDSPAAGTSRLVWPSGQVPFSCSRREMRTRRTRCRRCCCRAPVMQRRKEGPAGSPARQRGAERTRASRATWIRSPAAPAGKGAGWRRKPPEGRRRTPPPPAGHGKDAPLERLARSLTRREDWPSDAVGVRRSGGNSLPPLPVLQVVQPRDRPFELSGHGSRKPKPTGDAATPESRRRRASGPGGSEHPHLGLGAEDPLLIGRQQPLRGSQGLRGDAPR
jgi:hypothetical protein